MPVWGEGEGTEGEVGADQIEAKAEAEVGADQDEVEDEGGEVKAEVAVEEGVDTDPPPALFLGRQP